MLLPFDAHLATRIRERLGTLDTREVKMFGGLSFMVNEGLALAAASDGSLLLRVAPDRVEQVLLLNGARRAEMRGKPMSPGWIRADIDAVRDDEVLDRWIDEAVAHAETATS